MDSFTPRSQASLCLSHTLLLLLTALLVCPDEQLGICLSVPAPFSPLEGKGFSFCSRASMSGTETTGDSSQQLSACFLQRAECEEGLFQYLLQPGMEIFLSSPGRRRCGERASTVESLAMSQSTALVELSLVSPGFPHQLSSSKAKVHQAWRSWLTGGNIPFQETLVSGKAPKATAWSPSLLG